MKAGAIAAAPHYSALHSCQPGKQYGRFVADDVFTTKHSESLLRLPIFNSMSTGMQDRVTEPMEVFFTGVHGGVKTLRFLSRDQSVDNGEGLVGKFNCEKQMNLVCSSRYLWFASSKC